MGKRIHFNAGNTISVVGCIKACGEAGFMLAGLRFSLSENLSDVFFVLRDRQFCHCGNVEPPTEFKVDLEKCGTSCPKTPNDLGIVDPCGTTLHTMVSYHPFGIIPKICST